MKEEVKMPIRKLIVKPMPVGPYSHAVILPAWWLHLNDNPESIELALTMDVIEVRPVPGKTPEPNKEKGN